ATHALHSFPTRRSSDLNTLIADATTHGCKLALKRADETEIKSVAQSFAESGVTFANGETVAWKDISPDSVIELAKELMAFGGERSEEHTSELQSRSDLV